MEKSAKGNRPKKSCVTSFRKKEAKVGQKPCGAPCEGMVAACEGWWLRVRDGGYVREMVAACERWWLRARDDGCVRWMAHEMEAGGTIQTLAQKVRARFCEQVHRALP